MPLSEHEQRILEDIERQLVEDDPRLAEQVSTTSLYSHLARRIRWAVAGFFVGFALMMLFFLSLWVALVGFAMMLGSALLTYRYLKQMGQDQLRTLSREGRLSLPALLARWSGRFRDGSQSR
jgi:hypothetical protein